MEGLPSQEDVFQFLFVWLYRKGESANVGLLFFYFCAISRRASPCHTSRRHPLLGRLNKTKHHNPIAIVTRRIWASIDSGATFLAFERGEVPVSSVWLMLRFSSHECIPFASQKVRLVSCSSTTTQHNLQRNSLEARSKSLSIYI
jgi:hypothetical protein